MFEEVKKRYQPQPEPSGEEFVDLFVKFDGEEKNSSRRYFLFEQRVKSKWSLLSEDQRAYATNSLVEKGVWPREVLDLVEVFGGEVIGFENMGGEAWLKKQKSMPVKKNSLRG